MLYSTEYQAMVPNGWVLVNCWRCHQIRLPKNAHCLIKQKLRLESFQTNGPSIIRCAGLKSSGLEKYQRGAAAQTCYRVKVSLSAYWYDRELVYGRYTESLDGYRLLSRYLHMRQQDAESSSTGIDGHADGHTDKDADFGLDTTNLVSAETERLLPVLVGETRLAVKAGGRVCNMEMLTTELILVWNLDGGLIRLHG